MTQPEWRIYYADRGSVDSETPVDEVPSRGVLVVVQPDPGVGRIILSGHDYYVWREDATEWYGVFDRFGLWDYLASPGWKKILFGRTAPTPVYRAAYEEALRDPDFPSKSAFDGEQERERPPGVEL